MFLDLYKTKICPNFQKGTCKRGLDCNFAHTYEQLREQPNLKRTKLCHQYQMGYCPNDRNCKYAHGVAELTYTPDIYKTNLCYNYNLGKCQLGQKCRYAHGIHELRPATQNHFAVKKKEFHKVMNIYSKPLIPESETSKSLFFEPSIQNSPESIKFQQSLGKKNPSVGLFEPQSFLRDEAFLGEEGIQKPDLNHEIDWENVTLRNVTKSRILTRLQKCKSSTHTTDSDGEENKLLTQTIFDYVKEDDDV